MGNLSFQTTDEDLQRAFRPYGSVLSVKLVLDRETGRSRGFAFVDMSTEDSARVAADALNGASLDGRALRVSEAEERRPAPGAGYAGDPGPGSGPRRPGRGGDRR